MKPIQKIGVVGAGTMGHGIAQVFAEAGFEVVLVDQTKAFAEHGFSLIKKNLEKGVQKGKLNLAEAQAVEDRIQAGDQLSVLSQADFVVEAIIESRETKEKLFAELDRLCPPHTILASNTSSISIAALAAVTRRPEKVIGMHFMNPVPIMKLVEVIRGKQTSDESAKVVHELAIALKKIPVQARDFPGFIANRILMPMINEAIFAYVEGVGSKEAIDTVMKIGMNHPMGPLELADFIGLDVCLSILNVLYEGFGDPKYRPCPLLETMVKSGQLGRKTKKGFYDYP